MGAEFRRASWGEARVEPGAGDRFSYRHNPRGEGEDGRLDLTRRGGGRAHRRGRQEGVDEDRSLLRGASDGA